MLEYILNGIAWSLISEGRKIGEIITEDLTFWRVQEIVVELALHRFGEGHEDFRYLKEAVALVDTARKGRHDIIHSIWLELGGCGGAHQVPLRKEKRQFRMGEIAPTSKILAVVDDIDAAIQPLMAFLILGHPELFDAGASKVSEYLNKAGPGEDFPAF